MTEIPFRRVIDNDYGVEYYMALEIPANCKEFFATIRPQGFLKVQHFVFKGDIKSIYLNNITVGNRSQFPFNIGNDFPLEIINLSDATFFVCQPQLDIKITLNNKSNQNIRIGWFTVGKEMT